MVEIFIIVIGIVLIALTIKFLNIMSKLREILENQEATKELLVNVKNDVTTLHAQIGELKEAVEAGTLDAALVDQIYANSTSLRDLTADIADDTEDLEVETPEDEGETPVEGDEETPTE